MLVLLSQLGPLNGPSTVKRVCSATSGKDAAWNQLTTFVEISVNCAGCGHAAFGRRSEPAAYLLHFLFGQVTSAPAHQYSVLVIHGYSPFIFGSVARAQNASKEVFTAEGLYIGAAFAVESISIRAGVSRSWGGAKGCGTYSSTDVLDFLLAQGTSASAEQYSIQVIHLLSPFVILGLSMAHAFAKELRLRRAQPKCLTAELANVLISIRRRRAGAEGESSKSSIDDFRFCRRQFARSPANQHPVLVIHIFVLSSFGSVGAGPKLCKEKSSGGPHARRKSRSRRRVAMKINTRR
jgi:hypothetical protein